MTEPDDGGALEVRVESHGPFDASDFHVRFERVRQLALAYHWARKDWVALPVPSTDATADEWNKHLAQRETCHDAVAQARNAYEAACEEFFLNAATRSAP